MIALEGASGKELWRTRVNSELLSAPAIGEKVVVMRSVDGRLHGFDARSGKELWSVEQQVPRLSLRGTAIPVIAKEIAVSGFDNGKVMAVSLTTGDTVWDTALASPHGRTELDRLVDVDSAVSVVGDNVFADRLSGPHRHARARFGADLVGARHVELPRLVGGRGESVRDAIRRRRGGAAPARRVGSVAQRQAQAARLERARRDQHGDRGRRLSRAICTGWTRRRASSWRAQRVAKFRVSNPPVAVKDTVVVLTDSGAACAASVVPRDAPTPQNPAP